jgi:GNAT superfamily N-acetyltransferase
MRRLYRKLAFNYSEGGLKRLLQKAISFTLTTLYSESVWNIYIYTALSDLGASPPLMQCRTLKYQDLLDARYFKVAAFPEEIRVRFDRRNICYGFYSNESLAVVGWSSDGYLEVDHGVFFPCPSQVALFDFVTLPEFRGRGLYTNALRHLVRNMDNPGAGSVYIAVDPSNAHSVKGIRSAGFSPYLRISRRRILGFAFVSRSPVQSDDFAGVS